MLTLLLQQHAHNYSAAMAEDTPAPVPGLIRRAERFMADNAVTPIAVSDVAAHLAISLRSLQAGFRQWRATTRTSSSGGPDCSSCAPSFCGRTPRST
jgi:hypothetical protein